MILQPKDIDINQAIAICTRGGIQVASEPDGKKFTITVMDNGQEIRYKKTVYAHQINAVIKKVWRYYAAKILIAEGRIKKPDAEKE